MEKRLTRSTSEVNYGANSQGTAGAKSVTNEVKPKIIKLYHTPWLSVKALKRSVGGMVYRPTSKVIAPSKTYWTLQGQRPHGQQMWGHILVPVWWPYLQWWIHRKTSRNFGERFKEHLKEPSSIHHHSNNTGHPTTEHNFQIIGRGHGLARNI